MLNSMEMTEKFLDVIGLFHTRNGEGLYITDANGLKQGDTIITDEGLTIRLRDNIDISIMNYRKDLNEKEFISGKIFFGGSGINIDYRYITSIGHGFLPEKSGNVEASIMSSGNAIITFSKETFGPGFHKLDKDNSTFIDILNIVEEEYKNILQVPVR